MMSGHAMYSMVQQQGADDLLVRYAPLVKRIANHLSARLPDSVQIEDLIQAGMIGLLEAARQYDAAQGASFQTYAGIRIRGAMLDEVRKMDWTPRSVHRKSRDVADAIRTLENRTGREPKDAEVAVHLGIALQEYHQILQDVCTSRLFSINQEDPHTGEAPEPPGHEQGPGELLEQDAFQVALAEAIGNLPEREQLVMSLYYDDELNLREIGEVLGVSESRVSQIHGRILLKLKAGMADWVGKDS